MRTNILIAIIFTIIGLTAGPRFFPKVETKQVEVEKEVIKKDIVTITKEIIKPDGTKEIVTTTTDKTKEKREEKKELTVFSKIDYLASVSINKNLTNMQDSYTLTISKRFISDIYVGASYNTSKEVGLSLTLGF